MLRVLDRRQKSATVTDVCCFQEALAQIRSTWGTRLPVYLRAIAASRGRTVHLDSFSSRGATAAVENIEDILAREECTTRTLPLPEEKGLEIVRLGLPELTARLVPYWGENDLALRMLTHALSRVSALAEELADPEDQAALAPTVLVYAPLAQTPPRWRLLRDDTSRARTGRLVAAYLLDNLDCYHRDRA